MTSVDILFQEVRSCEHESSAADCSEIDWRFYKTVGDWQLADAKQIIGTDEWSDAVDSILSVLCRRYLFNSVAILRSVLDMITCSPIGSR